MAESRSSSGDSFIVVAVLLAVVSWLVARLRRKKLKLCTRRVPSPPPIAIDRDGNSPCTRCATAVRYTTLHIVEHEYLCSTCVSASSPARASA